MSKVKEIAQKEAKVNTGEPSAPQKVTKTAPRSNEEAVDLSFLGSKEIFNVPLMDEADAQSMSHVFLLFWHKDRWTIMDGKIVPELFELRTIPGCNSVRASPNTGHMGLNNFEEAKYEKIKSGWEMLDNSPRVGPGPGYLRKTGIKSKQTGREISIYKTPFLKLYTNSTAISVDEKEYSSWLRGLISQGQIGEIELGVLEEIIAKLRGSILSKQKKNMPASLIDPLLKKLEIWENKAKELARLEAAEEYEVEEAVSF